MKDKKFGFGGKKKGLKMNTNSSVNETSSFRPGQKKRSGASGGAKNTAQKIKGKRIGKARRQNQKSKGKK